MVSGVCHSNRKLTNTAALLHLIFPRSDSFHLVDLPSVTQAPKFTLKFVSLFSSQTEGDKDIGFPGQAQKRPPWLLLIFCWPELGFRGLRNVVTRLFIFCLVRHHGAVFRQVIHNLALYTSSWLLLSQLPILLNPVSTSCNLWSWSAAVWLSRRFWTRKEGVLEHVSCGLWFMHGGDKNVTLCCS
jgi:hypothetical protein